MSADFLESPRFPENVSLGFAGGPSFQTNIVVTTGGGESRNGNWAQPRHEYEAGYHAKKPARYKPLQAFFHLARGRLFGFRVKDWLDYTATATEGYMLATATTGVYQLYKRYTVGSHTYDRLINKPRQGSTTYAGVTLLRNGAQLTYGAGAGQVAFDESTGLVTFVTTPSGGDTLRWSGEFDVPCRFDTDKMTGVFIDKSSGEALVNWDPIPIIEIRDL